MPTAIESDTRTAILDAAEALFASQGISNVSLAEITARAGQRNGGAIHYHFGGREGLLSAILDRHEMELDATRMNRLIALRGSGTPTVEDLWRIVIEPLANQLDTESGRAFLAIQRQRLIDAGGQWRIRSAAVQLVAAEITAMIPDAEDHNAEYAERTRLIASMIMHRLADRSVEEINGTAVLPRAKFVGILVSAAVAVVQSGAET